MQYTYVFNQINFKCEKILNFKRPGINGSTFTNTTAHKKMLQYESGYV